MSDTNKQKIKFIPPTAQIPVTIPGDFFDKLQLVLIMEVKRLPDEVKGEVFDRLMSKKPSRNPDEDVIYMLTILVSQIRQSAEKNGLVQEKEVDEAMEEMYKIFQDMPIADLLYPRKDPDLTGDSSPENPPAQ